MTDRALRYVSTIHRPQVACPACRYSPMPGMQWICSPDGCGGTFDTFETRARCPHCEAQFQWTQCPACGRTSSHESWYHHAS